MHEITIVKYANDTRLVCYGHISPRDRAISGITHTMIDNKDLEEIQQATYSQVQKILEQYI